MQQLPEQPIIKALALTRKTTDYIEVFNGSNIDFSIEKFCFYLLSPGFIKAYIEKGWGDTGIIDLSNAMASSIGIAIHDYQKGNSQPLIDLLEKI